MPFVLLHLFTGPLTLLLGIIVLYFPPKYINHFYGYRTRQAMKSEKHWNYAHRVVGRLLVLFGIITLVVQGVLIPWMGWENAFLISLFVMVFFMVMSVVLTEDELRKRFGRS